MNITHIDEPDINDDVTELDMAEPVQEDVEGDEGQGKQSRVVGFKTLLVGLILAAGLGALGGAIGGAAISQQQTQNQTQKLARTVPDIAPLEAELSQLARTNKAIKADISRLEMQLATVTAAPEVDVSALGARLDRLEDSPLPEIDMDVVTRLEALQRDGSDALELSDILQRLTALEARPEPVIDLSSAPASAAPLDDIAPRVDVPPFPQAQVLAALEDQEAASQGFFQRTLKKHISVKTDDDPRQLVAGIMADLERDDIDGALAKFDQLPSQARSAAQDWRRAISR